MVEVDDVTWLLGLMDWFDPIRDGRENGYDYDGDLLLPARTALELIRDRLTVDQVAVLTVWDQWMMDHPVQFNQFFAAEHHRLKAEDRQEACRGYVWDDDGEPPPVPKDHWWWFPLPTNTKPRQ
ncbi:hypothetical protein [Insolitispirillum peregrinum]|uniref:Uncharacterized protein n=1 Tax=Insolitispirillum peregrinum TaxID=80876 RepID=A0A1N7LTB2_9PROT|nr:hypothetical protein [Insolitispirillum peregrinum]SIS77012.1 hypothetical protein SAMN05421779_103541 [Insolitispirillum peregrinum]